jgi:sterol desaturase/sphingolipid hydroxylase (fatty acid hydroxylase superfamily)
MPSGRSSAPERIRLFESALLETLTVISVRGFLALWTVALPAIVVVGVVVSPSFWAPALIAIGMVVWTATEYALHRFVFHFKADSPLIQRAIFVIHGNHHADPKDPLRNLMPPIVSIPVGATIWVLCWWALGPVGTWLLLGFMTGYVAYDLVHYACHQWPMKGRLARALKTHHMRHHHLHADCNFAITGMVWDRLLSTGCPPVKERG